MFAVGESILRKEGPNKVTGRTKYNADVVEPGIMVAYLVTSPYAHARIRSIDTAAALQVFGVEAVLTGQDTDGVLCGEVLEDRPPLARGEVRYFGEPVALIVAHGEAEAMRGAAAVRVDYEPLSVVNSPLAALKPDAPLVHPALGQYQIAQPPIAPQPGTNIADSAHIRKGDIERAWDLCDVVVEGHYDLPQLDHAAMETRSAKAEILHDGRVIIHSTTQAPFEVQKLLAGYFHLDVGNVIVNAPVLGGAFGGKAAVQLEVLAYLASRAIGGRLVRLVNPREHDLASSPVSMGIEAQMRLGATHNGRLVAAQMRFLLDIGAYTDSAPRMARAIAADSTGPYAIDHVHCDVLCVYTNHTYTTAFRGFGHMQMTVVIERTMDKLAQALGLDALQFRRLNAIRPGHRTPTGVTLTLSNLGTLEPCIDRLGQLLDWDQGVRQVTGPHTVRAKGASCFWKTSSSPPNAASGVLLTFNSDGSLNLSTGTVEVGAGTKTTAAQILAERLRMSVDKIHVHTHINTRVDPEHWKTVASMSTFMVGRAILEAADDIIMQLKGIAAIALRCAPGDLDVAGGRVFLKDDPSLCIAFKDIVHGFSYPDGAAVGGLILGRGSYIMRHLQPLDQATGQGRTGPAWTVGAQGVEVELDTRRFTYRMVRAATVLDAGRLINPMGAEAAVRGGMCQGLGYGSRESLSYSDQGELLNRQLRLYKMMRMGEQPEYLVDFVQTPQIDSPYGARPVGEHGVLAMPAALANALSVAAQTDFDQLPITPEVIWRAQAEVAP